MGIYRIVWTGTVIGETIVEANTYNEALIKADDIDIDIVEYPTDWEVDHNSSEEQK